jgi:hypothetical protein
MKKNNTNTEEKKENNIIGFIVAIVVAIIVIVSVIVVYNNFLNDSIYVDLNDPDLVETKDGYKKSVGFETTVDKKEIINEKKGKKYMIICYDGKEKYEIEVGNYIYRNLEIDEKIKVTGAIYYDESGLRTSFDYQVESLVDNDDNGIIDIPDGYKEPEPERVPGVDYGDGVYWG